MAIGSELWENTGDNPKKALDNYIIDSWRWPNVKKGYTFTPWTEGFHRRPHLWQLARSCGRTLETTPKKHLIIILYSLSIRDTVF